jgi:hypothetical protein
MAIACARYCVIGIGHHQTTFEGIELALGASVTNLASYFDTHRRERNILDYDSAQAVTETEAKELIREGRRVSHARGAVDYTASSSIDPVEYRRSGKFSLSFSYSPRSRD